MENADFEVVARLARVRAGDETAAKELVEQHYPLVLRVVRGHRPRAVAEEDIAQEVFIKMFARLEQFRSEMPFSHWLSRIAYNTCIDHLRAQYRRSEWRMADLTEDEAKCLENCCQDDSTQESLSNAMSARELAKKLLDRLSPKDRIVVSLLDMQGRSVAEVALETGFSQTLVKVRAFRARRKLRKLMIQWQKEKKV